MQPAVSVWFYGTSDGDMPDYLKINGTSGLALALADSEESLCRLTSVPRRSISYPAKTR
ncbi:hypothetical protein VRB18_22450 [Erwinia aphidicola]